MNPFPIVHAPIRKTAHALTVVLSIYKLPFVANTSGKSLNALSGSFSLYKGTDVDGSVLESHVAIRIMRIVANETSFVLSAIGKGLASLAVTLAVLEATAVDIAILPGHATFAVGLAFDHAATVMHGQTILVAAWSKASPTAKVV